MHGVFLQEIPLARRKLIADAALHDLPARRVDFANELGRGFGEDDVFIGRDQESTRAAGGVAHGLADFRAHHLDDNANEMARGAELRGAFLLAEIAGERLEEVALHIGILAQQVEG